MIWLIIIIVVIIFAIIAMYNGLVQAKMKTENAWSQIEVQLQRRFDLIPNLVEAVKGYMGYTLFRRLQVQLVVVCCEQLYELLQCEQ